MKTARGILLICSVMCLVCAAVCTILLVHEYRLGRLIAACEAGKEGFVPRNREGVLFFFSPLCGSCKDDIKELNAHKGKEPQYPLYAVSYDIGEYKDCFTGVFSGRKARVLFLLCKAVSGTALCIENSKVTSRRGRSESLYDFLERASGGSYSV